MQQFCTENGRNSYIRQFPVMGTAAMFRWNGVSAETAQTASERAEQAFAEVVAIANLRDPESELSRLNASAYGRDFHCSGKMWAILSEAETAWKVSGGAFDITIKPLMDLWGFYRKQSRVPDPESIAEVRKKCGFEKLKLDHRRKTIRFTVPGMALDLGGIAKGYALELAFEAVEKTVRSGVLDLGGNLKFLMCPPPERTAYSVAVKDPAQPGKLLDPLLEVPPAFAVSTSGDYERFVVLENRRFGHIIDPASGIPELKQRSATVICSNAMRADWLSTAFYLRGKDLLKTVQQHYPDCRVIMAGE